MADRTPIPLRALLIPHTLPLFDEVCAWPFKEGDGFVAHLLREDVPRRAVFGQCRIWLYLDPVNQIVGFGTLDVCEDYSPLAGGHHPHIPLLSINPAIKSKGYGTTILLHLISEAALLATAGACRDLLTLEVYLSSTKAIDLYLANGFAAVTDDPRHDPDAGGAPYYVMARRVSVAAV